SNPPARARSAAQRSTSTGSGSTHVSVQVTAEQREALHEELLINLSGIDAIWHALCSQEVDRARVLAQNYFDDLLLLLDDLASVDDSQQATQLTTSPAIVRGVLERVERRTEAQARVQLDEALSAASVAVETQRTLAACRSIIAALDADQ